MYADDGDRRARVTTGSLVAELGALGVQAGATVLVHSSLSRLGRVDGGADAVIDALLEAVGPTGTVLFPTLTGARQDGPDHPPRIDVRTTPCWTGRIPETARQRPDAIRSLHPTHSIAAIGAGAERYAFDHESGASPCDDHSPYHRLIEDAGHILLLGDVTQDSNTTIHCLEELADVPYHLQRAITEGIVIDARGRRHTVPNRLHDWRWERDFLMAEAPLVEAGAVRIGPVGRSTSRLIAARGLADTILPILRDDPLWLLSDAARAQFEARAY